MNHQLTRREAAALFFAAPAFPALQNGSPPVELLYRGTEAPRPRQIELQAGPLTMIFEPELAQLRYIRLGGREVLRAVYAAVRDRNWGTVAPAISNLKIETSDNTFHAAFDITCKQGDIDFVWHGTIKGSADGAVRFDMDGKARSTFLRNRLGFCVLHPIEGVSGQPVTVEKTDGSAQKGAFPDYISPHQPFLDMRAIRHTVLPGVDAEVRFEGDVFEMEDHRNWTDASYKTYCTPLAKPFPVEVKQGTVVRQSVSLKLIGNAAAPGPRSATSRDIAVNIENGKSSPAPRLGTGLSEAPDAPARLKAIGLSHLRVDLKLGSGAWKASLARASQEADALGAALEVALTLENSPEQELQALKAALTSERSKVAHFLVFHRAEKSTTAKWMDLARRILGPARLGSGTDAYFTELNRERPPVAQSDLVCYSINPQVHAFDDMSLVETLSAQAETVRSARQFCGKLPISVTPVTLKPRFNPNATSGGPQEPDSDVRQTSLFAAGWTLGSLKYLAESGAASVTFYEAAGPRGLMDSKGVFPLYHVLADVAEFAGGEVTRSVSAEPLSVESVVLQKSQRRRVLLANFSPAAKVVRLTGLDGAAHVVSMDEHSASQAMREPEVFRKQRGRLIESRNGRFEIPMLPYAVVRLDHVLR